VYEPYKCLTPPLSPLVKGLGRDLKVLSKKKNYEFQIKIKKIDSQGLFLKI
jgi:hypothetical protein